MTPRARHLIRYQLPAIVWALVIFTASSFPAAKLPRFVFKINDKLIHVSIFLVFGLFVYRALELKVRRGSFELRRALLTVSAVAAYGILDELHQIFVPGRTPDIWDVAADTVGGILSALILYFVYRGREGEAAR
jgi:VanZ family protein